jgi:hypothetical protein
MQPGDHREMYIKCANLTATRQNILSGQWPEPVLAVVSRWLLKRKNVQQRFASASSVNHTVLLVVLVRFHNKLHSMSWQKHISEMYWKLCGSVALASGLNSRSFDLLCTC